MQQENFRLGKKPRVDDVYGSSSSSEGEGGAQLASNRRSRAFGGRRDASSPFLRSSASHNALSSTSTTSSARSDGPWFNNTLGAEGIAISQLQFGQHRRALSSERASFSHPPRVKASSNTQSLAVPVANGIASRSDDLGPPQGLFTPAGDTIPPIATSRSTTALLMKKKQLPRTQEQQLAISSMFPWTGHLNGSTSRTNGSGGISHNGLSSSAGSADVVPNGRTIPPPGPPPPHSQMTPLAPHVQVSTHAQGHVQPLPDHPPPPYSEACSDETAQGHYANAIPVNLATSRHARTPSASLLTQGSSSSLSQGFVGPSSLPSSAMRSRSPVRPQTDHQHRFQAEFSSNSHLWAPAHSQHPSQSHSPISSASSSRASFTSPGSVHHRSGAGVRYQAFEDSDWDSSDMDSRRGEDERDAIYTSPSRRRKGKERANLSDDEDTPTPISGHSSSISPLYDHPTLHDRRHSRSHHGNHDNGGDGNGYSTATQPTMPKSCLKSTPSSSSASLSTTHFLTPSASSSSISTQHEPGAPTPKGRGKPNLGVRFVRFTLGLGSGKNKVKEREKEPRLICTTPGEACAGETETETDEPSSRRLPTARKPPPPTSRLGSLGFGSWRSSPPSSLRPPSGPISGSSPLRSSHSPVPTSPISASSASSFSSTSKFTAFLFQFFRLLSVVPAVCALIYFVWMLVSFGGMGSEGERKIGKEYMDRYWSCVPLPPGSFPTSGTSVAGVGGAIGGMLFCDEGRGVLRGPPVPGRVDWVVSAFWALLTAHHCLGLSTGLFARWKVYYTPSSTLVRLLALQGICWQATHLTLYIVGGSRRPVAAWAVIGTCTAVSRSVQIWVTSNIVRESEDDDDNEGDAHATKKGPGAMMRFVHAFAVAVGGGGSEEGSSEDDEGGSNDAAQVPVLPPIPTVDLDDSIFESSEPESPIVPTSRSKKRRRRGRRRYKERWWDWKEVGLKCMLPTGLVYFLMAWAEVGRREWGTWYGGYDVYSHGYRSLEGLGVTVQ